MHARAPRAVVSALLGLAFAAGLAGEAYGAHDCPHHDADGRRAAAAHGQGGGDTSGLADRSAAEPPLEAPPRGPCTCVGSCHATATALHAASPPVLPAAVEADLPSGVPVAEGRVPRLEAYLLPFANGPPLPRA